VRVIQTYRRIQKNPNDQLLFDEEYQYYDFPQGSKVSHDELAVLEPDGRTLWATQYLIKQANEKLSQQGSAVRLGAGTQKKVGGFLGVTYSKVVPQKFASGKVVEGPFTLPGDCGKAAMQLLGTSWGVSYGNSDSGSLTSANNVFSEKQYGELVSFLSSNPKYLVGLLPTVAISEITPDNHREILSKLSQEAQLQFNKKYGYDHYATPGVGQAYVMFPAEGRPGFQETQCPYHFGYVLMESGKDRITLEQYTGRNETDWYFEMYQPGDPEKDFQKRWNSAFNNYGITGVAYKGRNPA